jgi:polysaccharide biosynthesis protein PslH
LARGRPPLLDRYSGFAPEIQSWIEKKTYRLAVVEHFWCAPYAGVLRSHTERLAVDLHNIESALQQSMASSEKWPLSTMFRRFGRAYARLERECLPHFDDVLVTSRDDAARVEGLAPGARVIIYPNTVRRVPQPEVDEQDAIAFSGNLEYEPNVSAVEWFGRDIWPGVREAHPSLEWRLIGKNPGAVRLEAPGMKIVGPVEDAVYALAQAKIAVVPLLSGSGTRFKILEAWAAGRAVISTSLGAEGLGANSGEHLIVADDAAHFAAAINTLLCDPGLRARLGANGRQRYLDYFTTEAGWRALEDAGFGS